MPKALKVKHDRRPRDWEALRPLVAAWAAEGRTLKWMMAELGYKAAAGNASAKLSALIPEEFRHRFGRGVYGGWNRVNETYESASTKAASMPSRGSKAQSLQVRVKALYLSEHQELCEACGIGPWWRGKPLTLELDHRDGDWRNYAEPNLRLLCPTCHRQRGLKSIRHRL